MQLYDYTLNNQSPLQSFNTSYNMGSVIRQQQDAAKLAEAQKMQAEEEKKRQEQVYAMFDKLRSPGATAKDYANLAMAMPKDAADAILNSYKTVSEAEAAADLKDTSEVFSAFVSGNSEYGINLLRRHAEAERVAGNEANAKDLEDFANKAEESKDGAESIQNLLGYTMTAMPGGKDAVETILKYNEDRRKAIEHPDLVLKQKADREKAESDAEKAAVDAAYAEKFKIADLETKAKELGLTKEQTNEIIARTKKIDAEIAKLLMELKALEKTGGVTPEKKFEQEEKIRGEYQKRVANYNEMRQTLDNIKASSADSSGAGDIALVTGFMKMLDPGSVVRESEFATARDTAGLYGTLQAVSNKVKNGQFLTPQQRKDFSELAEKYMESAKNNEIKVRKDLSKVVEGYGLSTERVFGVLEEPKNKSQKTEADALSAASRQTSSKKMVEVDY